MGARQVFIVVPILVVSLLSTLSGCAGSGEDTVRAVPTFPSAQAQQQSATKARDTLLPNDCAGVLTGVDISALLGQPIDSVQAKAVIGVSAPAVGRLEKVTCLYRRTANRGGGTDVELNLYAYTDEDAAFRHTSTNINAQRPESPASQDVVIGTARGALMTQRGQTALLVSSGRSALSMTMRTGVVPADQVNTVMLDLAQRVLPNLAPEWHAESR